MRTDLFIGNEWAPAASGRRFDVQNPATEELLASVAEGDAADIDRAVAAARACFESAEWRGLSARKRGALLFKAADLLASRLPEMAELETRQNGKPLFESKIDVSSTVETLRYYAGWCDKFGGETVPVDGNFLTYIRHEPIGVIGAIVPWNFPLNIAGWKFAPALAAGCTVVLKPASETPLTALLMGEIFAEAGLPAGAFNVVPGHGSTAGSALVRHPDVDKISFTGSTSVGQRIMQDAAGTVKRLTLELGGKSPNIIFDDADIAAAVRGAQTGIFYGKGEVCAAGSRLLVDRKVKDQVVEQLAARCRKLLPGDPFDKTTRLGAVVSKKQQESVLQYIGTANNEGATLVAGGKAATVNGKGFFVEATIFDDVAPTMTIAREEIFGPVLAVIAYEDEEDAIRIANDSDFGLSGGVWSASEERALAVARRIRTGTVNVNGGNFYAADAPFGGYKQSGIGREMGPEGFEEYLETKTIAIGV